MEEGRKSEKAEMLPGGKHQYVIFDHSHSSSSVTAFYPIEANLGNFEYMKHMAMGAMERARAGGSRTNSFVLQILGGGGGTTLEAFDKDQDELQSDAESLQQQIKDAAAAVEAPPDEERSVDDVLKEKRVRRKLEVLAQMVGVDSGKPGIVLDEVVRVLRNLERTAAQL